jgi:dTDP-glucose 4,6-dehydratase
MRGSDRLSAKIHAHGANAVNQNPLARDLNHIIAHTGDLWEGLRGCRLLITGGTGFVGRWLLESLLWAEDRYRLGLRAVILTRDPVRFAVSAPSLAAHPSIALLAGDMGSFAPPDGDIDFVIHAATEMVGPPGTYDPVHKFDSDVEGMRRVLATGRQRGARRLIFTSSGAAYGRQPPDLAHVPEEYPGAPDPTDPSTAYGQAKRASEFLCAAAAATGDIEVVIARCFAFAGPYLPVDSNYAFGNFMRDALAGGPVVIAGDGTSRRSYLYTADLAIWLWTLLLKGRSGRVYNVGSDVDVSIESLARTIVGIVSPGAEVEVLGRAAVGTPAARYVPSIERARTELGLAPLVPLTDAIERTAAWHRARQFNESR